MKRGRDDHAQAFEIRKDLDNLLAAESGAAGHGLGAGAQVLCELFDARAAMILRAQTTAPHRLDVEAAWGFDPALQDAFVEHVGHHSQGWSRIAARRPVLGPSPCLWPSSTPQTCHRFARRSGLGPTLAAAATMEGDEVGLVFLFRHQGDASFDRHAQLLLHRSLPHLRVALAVRKRTAELEWRLAACRAVLDRIPFGALIFGADGRFLVSNALARRFVAEAPALMAPDAGPAGGVRPGPAIESLLAHRRRPRGLAPTRMASVGGIGGNGIVAVAQSLPGLAQGTTGTLVFLTRRQPHLQPAEALLGAFGLTESEAGLAVALAAGASVEEACEDLGIRPSTARSHLKSIFRKTGTTRQSQVVQLLCRIVWQLTPVPGW